MLYSNIHILYCIIIIIQYTYGATSPDLNNFYNYPTLVRTYPGASQLNSAYVALVKKFGWTRVGIVFDHQENEGIFNKVNDYGKANDLWGR